MRRRLPALAAMVLSAACGAQPVTSAGSEDGVTWIEEQLLFGVVHPAP